MADAPNTGVIPASQAVPTVDFSPSDTKGARITAQLKKLTEANGKYKTLLKLAKERIQKQEEELERVKNQRTDLEEQLIADEKEASKQISLDEGLGEPSEEANIVQVCQRVKVPREDASEDDEIWALMGMEVISQQDTLDYAKRFKEWKRFDTESELQDFIRCDTGEPLVLPPYSISPEQSARIQVEAVKQVSQVTEEFRRFRIRSELARKQADAQIRDLQSSQVQSAAKRIEGQDRRDSEQERRGRAECLKAELSAQEAQWKEAYDLLLQENTALKSSGSEALLAAQWRQRYEACLKEKEALQSIVKEQLEKSDQAEADKYEMKYRDLKESFRLYRKKAKELFDQQGGGSSNKAGAGPQHVFSLADTQSADTKLSYLKNLMLKYLSSELAVREHMESAIGTILEFTPEEISQIEKKKVEQEAWF